MEKNQTFVAVADALSTNGEGIVRVGDVTVFVPDLIPGEKAEIKILKRKGNIAYGKTEEILVPAEDRVRPQCPVFLRCGGCQIQHLSYRTQLKFKTKSVHDALQKIGGIDVPVAPCVKSETSYGYRNKLQLPIGKVNGKNAVGFYAARSHRIVPTNECPIHPEWSEKLISAVVNFMEKCGLDGYDEERGEGQLRHIVVRELRGRFIVTLVVTVSEIKGIDYFLYLLDGIFPEYSFYLNFNAKKTNVIFGEKFQLLKGKGVYECTEHGIVYEAGAQTFVQVNGSVRGKLYDRVVSLVDPHETVIDCYAGGGLLTAMLAKKCVKAYGVEVVPEASRCADAVRLKNGLADKMENVCGKVEDVLENILKSEPNATLVLDPPRAGVDRSVLKAVMSQGVRKIVMISCDPATLARDVGILTGGLWETETGELVKANADNGMYLLESVEPFDMFPQTKHVETLVCLRKKT
ncbi:MAG: 23S rRNA (uracil(1939)-C(5))-methyltransferase RlmD [Clostridia bacterium]|nr:23S rRNA (uracil(1939)-C(5))-methyltransferase RlmD [Clostridia bacterium]